LPHPLAEIGDRENLEIDQSEANPPLTLRHLVEDG
jgi:hypothetical protein